MSKVIVLQAASRVMNPLLDQEMIDAELAEDREAASSEWLGQFRSSTVQFLDDELIDSAIASGCAERPFARHQYQAFTDPSGGRGDAFTLSICHRDGERVIQDRLEITNSPFVPDDVVERYAEILKSYGCVSVTGDRYAGEWPSAAFAKQDIAYVAASKDKSAIYLESLPQFTARNVEILDVQRLHTELRLLERRPRAGGRGDVVDHPPRAHDDAANATCGAIWLAAQELADDASQVLPSAWLRAAQERWKPTPPHRIPMCAIGLGLRGFRDPVLAIRHDGWFSPLVVVPPEQARHGRDLAASVLRHRRNEALPVIDVGESLGGQAHRHIVDNRLEAFAFRAVDEVQERTVEKQLGFADRRSAAFWRFREALDPEQDNGSPIALPDDPELIAQLEAVTWELTTNGIRVASKDKVEQRLCRPSTRADAVVLAWYKGPRAMTHFPNWFPEERLGPSSNYNRRPTVNFGPRHAHRRARRR